MALSMAVNGCYPVSPVSESICCYWEHMTIDFSQGLARVEHEPKYNTILVH